MSLPDYLIISAVFEQLVLLGHPPGQAAVIVCAGARNEGGAQTSPDTVLNGLTFPGLFLKLAEIFLAPSSVMRYFCPRFLVLLALISQLGVAEMSNTIFIKLTVKLASVAWKKGIRWTGE